MASIPYVGIAPTAANEITNRLAISNLLATAPVTIESVQDQINTLTTGGSPTYASKAYVDSRDASFQLTSYYLTQDGLNLPLDSAGDPNGVATLDGAGTIPVTQLPVLGAGYVQGPYGLTATHTGTTGATPLKVADWDIGPANLAFRPLVYMMVFATGNNAHPVIEVRIADSETSVGYDDTTLVAMGEGRTQYNDYHAIAVVPVPDDVGQTPSYLGPTYDIWLSAWLYDLNGNSTTVSAGNIVFGSAFLLRAQE